MRKFIKEFKEFIAKGNVMDMAVAVVIGGAFGKIVNSLVNDIIMPLISILTNGINVSDWKWVIKAAEYDAAGNMLAEETALTYGTFIQTILEFFIISFCIFVALKLVLSFKTNFEKISEKKEEEENTEPEIPAETTEDILKDIRNLLTENKNN